MSLIGENTGNLLQRMGLQGGTLPKSAFATPAEEKDGPGERSSSPGSASRTSGDIFARTDELDELEGEEAAGKPKEAYPQEFYRFDENADLSPYLAIVDQMARQRDENGQEVNLTDTERQNLARALSSYDPATLQNISDSKVRILLVDPNNPNSTGNMQWGDNGHGGYVNGGYNRLDKTISLRQDQFNNPDGLQPKDVFSTRHEIGHAIDDMLVPDGIHNDERPYAESTTDPRIIRSYVDYMKKIENNPDAKWEDYANRETFGPHEYLAEGIAHYMQSDETRRELQEKDPQLYQQIEEILNKSKDTSLPDKQQQGFLGNLCEGIGDAVKGITDAIGNVIKGIGDAIGGLFKGLFGQG